MGGGLVDADAQRAVIIEKANKALALGAQLEMSTGADLAHEAAETMMELGEAIHDLDEWLRAGGQLPLDWDRHTLRNINRKQTF